MHRHYSFGTADLVALMSAHRTAMQRGAKSDALQREFTRITFELDPPLDQPRHSGKTLLPVASRRVTPKEFSRAGMIRILPASIAPF